jgi:hypothetical protein
MRIALVVFGAAVCAAVTGAAAALVALPPLVLIASACAVVLFAIRSRGCPVGGIATGLALGAALALTLPNTAPPAAEEVVTRGARGGSGDLFALLDGIDRDPRSVLGTRVSVTGEWAPPRAGRPATVSRRIMTCCAADAIAVGFDVIPVGRPLPRPGSVVRITGVLRSSMRGGEMRYEIASAGVTCLWR